jgi:hypothetical protein
MKQEAAKKFANERPFVWRVQNELRFPVRLLRSLGYFSNLYFGFIKIFLQLNECFLCRLERASPSGWIPFEMSPELPDRFLRPSTDIPNRNRSAFRQSLDFVQHDRTASVFNTITRAGNWFETQNGFHRITLQNGRIPQENTKRRPLALAGRLRRGGRNLGSRRRKWRDESGVLTTPTYRSNRTAEQSAEGDNLLTKSFQ